MEPLDDSKYLEPPSDVEWCEEHEKPRPCPECRAEMQEWEGGMKRETR